MPLVKSAWNPFDPDDPGPCIKVIIMPTEEEIRLGGEIGLEYPEPLPITALLDTGSPFTIVNRVFARNRKLKLTNKNVPIRTIGGLCYCDEHSCSIYFPDSDLPKILVARILAADFEREPNYSCLIGRDVLRNWNAHFSGPSRCVTITA